MPLVQEVVNWAIANADNIKPIPPSPAGKQYPARPNQSMQEMMGAIARWRDDIDAAIAAAATSGLIVTPTPATDQVVLWDDAGTTVGGNTGLSFDRTFHTLSVGDGIQANSGRINLKDTAIGNPQFSFRQVNTTRATIGWLHSGSTLELDSLSGDMQFQTASTTALRIDTGQNTEVINQLSVSDVIGNNRLRITASGTNGIINYANNGPFKLQQNSADRITLNNDAEVLINTGGRLVAGDVSATTGASVIEGTYTGASRLFVAGSTRSAGRSYLARGVRADSVTNEGYESSADNVAFARGAFEVGGDTFHWLGAASATVAIGTDVAMTEYMSLDNGNLNLAVGAILATDTLTGNEQNNINMFSNVGATAAQSGSFYNKLVIWGGGSQTRTLELYQVPSGNAFINSSYSLNTLEVTGFANVIIEGDLNNYVPDQDAARDNTDFNTLLTSQFHNASNAPANLPAGASNYSQLIVARGIDTGLQIYGGYANDRLYFRGWHSSGTFYQWYENISNAGGQVIETNLTIGSASGVGTLAINGPATGNPKIEFNQTTTLRAFLQYLDSGDIFVVDADGEIQIKPNNTTAATFNTSGNAIFEGNVEVKGQAYSPTQTLTQAATIAWNLDLGNSAVTTMTGNRTLGAPTNMRAGSTYTLKVIQDATGTRTLAYNAVFKWPGGLTPVLSTGGSDIDILTFVSDGTNMYGVIQKDFT